mgnify:CR=1 FL=1
MKNPKVTGIQIQRQPLCVQFGIGLSFFRGERGVKGREDGKEKGNGGDLEWVKMNKNLEEKSSQALRLIY